MDVFRRVAEIAGHAGFYALTLQSLDADSTAFYRSLGFVEYGGGTPTSPNMLYPLKGVLDLVRGRS